MTSIIVIFISFILIGLKIGNLEYYENPIWSLLFIIFCGITSPMVLSFAVINCSNATAGKTLKELTVIKRHLHEENNLQQKELLPTVNFKDKIKNLWVFLTYSIPKSEVLEYQ